MCVDTSAIILIYQPRRIFCLALLITWHRPQLKLLFGRGPFDPYYRAIYIGLGFGFLTRQIQNLY